MERKWNELLREKVNSTGYIRAKYENHNGKDEFSVICSVMDWLDVGLTNMDRALEELQHSDRLVRCMKFYQYIWCIDVIWECVCQLQRVFINEKLPLRGDSSVFNRKYYDKDDNAYFKEIRACFGAHSVKLDEDENGYRKFASWSGSIDNQEFSVSIYSNNPNAEYRQVCVTISELQLFIEKRCQYIQKFLDIIDNEAIEYENEMKNCTILKSSNTKKQIDILKEEAYKRIGGGIIIELLEQIESFLATEFHSYKNQCSIEEFKSKILYGLDEIYDSLQNMQFDDPLDIEAILMPTYKPNQNMFDYEFAQLFRKVINHSHGVYKVETITVPLADYICFEYKSANELYWLTVIALNRAQQDLKNEILCNNVDSGIGSFDEFLKL